MLCQEDFNKTNDKRYKVIERLFNFFILIQWLFQARIYNLSSNVKILLNHIKSYITNRAIFLFKLIQCKSYRGGYLMLLNLGY